MPESTTIPAAPIVGAADYIKAFGDAGARWFYEGKSFADSTSDFITKMKADHAAELEAERRSTDAVRAENAKLKRDVDLLRGNEPASFSCGDKYAMAARGDADELRRKTGMSEGMAAYAAGLKESLANLPQE